MYAQCPQAFLPNLDALVRPFHAYPTHLILRSFQNILNFIDYHKASFGLTLIVLMWRTGWAHNNARK